MDKCFVVLYFDFMIIFKHPVQPPERNMICMSEFCVYSILAYLERYKSPTFNFVAREHFISEK